MNIFKRLVFSCIGLILYLVFPLKAEAMLNIVASFPQDSAIAKAVGGNYVSVISLAKASNDPHAVQPKPSLAVALNRADLLITNGQDMELAWLPIALANARNPRILEDEPGYFDPSKGVNLIAYTQDELRDTPFYSLNIIGGSGQGGGKNGLKRGNHHYWLDPDNGIIVAHNIAKKLAQLDPSHKNEFIANANRLESTLRTKMKKWDAAMAPFKGTAVVSYHRDWIYLIQRHDLNLIGYVEPRETIPPSAGEVTSLIIKMRKNHVKILMTSPWQNQRIPHEIARQTGAIHLSLPSSVGLDVGVKDYVDMFDVIYTKLLKALRDSK